MESKNPLVIYLYGPYAFRTSMGIFQFLCFRCIQDAHVLLVNFEYFSTDAILLNSIDVFKFDKTIK